HVADLDLVRNASQGNDSPILKLKRRHGSELLFCPRKVAHNEPAANAPQFLALWEPAYISQALRHDAASSGRYVDTDPLSVEVLRGYQGGATSAECVQNDVVGIARSLDYSLKQG